MKMIIAIKTQNCKSWRLESEGSVKSCPRGQGHLAYGISLLNGVVGSIIDGFWETPPLLQFNSLPFTLPPWIENYTEFCYLFKIRCNTLRNDNPATLGYSSCPDSHPDICRNFCQKPLAFLDDI